MKPSLIKSNAKYGLDAADFAMALSGLVFICIALGTTIVGLSNYNATAFRLLSYWTIGTGVLTWLLLWLSSRGKTADV